VRIRGRVASLLEVGTGFHPELTGRENIFLNGAILGMTREEIKRKFDEIVAFAEIEKFLDTPVKRYSSGMYVRLAFAVAAHLEPEILLVDEVLAVGDAQFQKKCMGKMENVAQEGRTVFFVSHNMASIKRLCTSAMCLSNGRLVEKGEPHSVITDYLEGVSTQDATVELPDQLHLVKSPIQIQSVEILNSKSEASSLVLFGEDILIRLAVQAREQVAQAKIGVGIYAEGIRIATIHSSPIDFNNAPCLQYMVCRIPGNTLMPNFYSLHVGAYSLETGRGLDWVPDAITFRIESVNMAGSSEYDPKDHGLVKLEASWESVFS
jgi:lipopolysaccharide transport system ATP-binding protein